MKKIKLSGKRGINKYILVDDEDYKFLSKFSWYAEKGQDDCYGAAHVFVHRLVLGAEKGEIIDHINGNTLDNRKSNLRRVTRFQNAANSKAHRDSKSGIKGIFFWKGYWVAKITIKGKVVKLGKFKSKIKAAETYRNAHLKEHGEFSNFNVIKQARPK